MSVLKNLIGVVNLSTKVSNDQIRLAVVAAQKQLDEDVAPNWHMDSAFVMFYDDPTKMSLRAFPVVIVDHSDTPGALGFHSEQQGRPYGMIMVDPILDNGGVALYDYSNPQNVSVSSVLSHEIIELFLDRFANMWADGIAIQAGSSYAYEGADPVEAQSYTKQIGKHLVSVSNFILPAWFDPQNAPSNPTDFLNILNGASFALAPNGYMIVRNAPGSEQQVFAATPPAQWRLDMKKNSIGSRTSKRIPVKVVAPKLSWWRRFITFLS